VDPDALVARLRTALSAAAPRAAGRSPWWVIAAILVVLGILAVVAGVVWIILSGFTVAPLILLFAGAVVADVAALARWRARRRGAARLRADTALTLRGAVDHVLREDVVDPIRGVLMTYDECRGALEAAR
jgi:uncharacterized membrane-anchored protein